MRHRPKQKAGPAERGTGQLVDFDAPSNYHSGLLNTIEGCEFGDTRMNENSGTWLVNRLVPTRGLTILGGASGSGKSFLAIDLAMAVATGAPFLGVRTEPVPVLFLSTEDSQDSLARRFWPHVERFAAIKASVPLRFAALNLDLWRQDRHALTRVNEQVGRVRKRRGAGPGLIVFDTVQGMSHGLDENSPAGMGAILRFLRSVATAHDCAVMAVHHTPQSGEKLRGHGSLHAAAQAVLMIGSSILSCAKAKDGPSDLKLGFRLRPVVIGMDQYGDAITTCVIEPAEVKERTPEERLSADFRIMDHLRQDPNASQADMAKALGKSRGYVNKVLQRLAGASKLIREGGRYRLPETVHAEAAVNGTLNTASVQ